MDLRMSKDLVFPYLSSFRVISCYYYITIVIICQCDFAFFGNNFIFFQFAQNQIEKIIQKVLTNRLLYGILVKHFTLHLFFVW